MFRFVYAWQPGDAFDPAAIEGFVGVETDAAPPDGLTWLGRRLATAGGIAVSAGNPPADADAVPAGGYVVLPATEGEAAAVGMGLHALAERTNGIAVLIENGGAFRSSAELWTLMEAARHPRVRVALDADRALASGQSLARLVPTLNLRIGLIRVRTPDADLSAYARRLAGIGFEGYVVLDPPAGPNRPERAATLAAVFRGIFPTRPVKRPASAKPVAPGKP